MDDEFIEGQTDRVGAARPGETHHTTFDIHGSEEVSTHVVQAVSEALDAEPTELSESLHSAIDVDAFERLFSDRPNGEPRLGGRVAFRMNRCEVEVHSDGNIYVTRL